MTNALKKLEKVFWLFLLINPFLDLVYGLQVYFLCGGHGMLETKQLVTLPALSVSMLIRMIVALLMIIYILLRRKPREILACAGVAAAFALSIGLELLRAEQFSLRADFSYMVRFSFNIVSLIVFAALLSAQPSCRRRLEDILCATLLVPGVSLHLCCLFQTGFYTYADPLGARGCRGFYFAGNDVAAQMMLLLPILICACLQRRSWSRKRCALYLASIALGLNALVILGTKTAYIAVIVIFCGIGLYCVASAVRRREALLLRRFGEITAAIVIAFVLMALVSDNAVWKSLRGILQTNSEYMAAVSTETVVLSGRSTRMFNACREYLHGGVLTLLFGLGRGTQNPIIEMDIFEVVFYYGTVGAVLMLWIYVKNGVLLLLDFFRHFSLTAWCGMLALLLGCAYLFLAGHTLFSVTSGFYFVLTILYVRHFAVPEGSEVHIL